MVLFENINVNQRVEVLRDGLVYCGTVKYKGCINGISGEWVGIELDLPGTRHIGPIGQVWQKTRNHTKNRTLED